MNNTKIEVRELVKTDPNLAHKKLSQLVQLTPNDTEALMMLARLELEGSDYLEALNNIHQQLTPRFYVEVGVCRGASFQLVDPNTKAIGIDPEPQLDVDKLPKCHTVITSTSDSYFTSKHTNIETQSLDMAFIDGMHLFEYALRDFINLEKFAHEQSTILIHDVYPITEITANRERQTDFWSGDVWKLMLCLQELRPDLECFTLPCPPTGLGVIRRLDPNNDTLEKNLAATTRRYKALSFNTIKNHKKLRLNVVDTDHPLLIKHT